ncbi:MAG: hypothetical protein A3C47_02945 [Omnitrophica bacterium RIFCSPHIGHO2_02_FULL_51_18]|nr:MAG: hypothetical protein A3C47_02945 [Omnitrophica bacterium RIFCSPHIGHO2_02_FULL_51_18]
MLKKIFVVDDDKAVTDFIETALQTAGYECVVSNTAEGVLERARREKPDLIILDIVMPGTDGVDLNIALKGDDATRNIPVVFLTGLIQKSEEQADISKKDIILAKPFLIDQLLVKIREVVKG